MKCTDPSRMTQAERLAELAEILAAGIQRMFAQECKPSPAPQNAQQRLDVVGRVEAPCRS